MTHSELISRGADDVMRRGAVVYAGVFIFAALLVSIGFLPASERLIGLPLLFLLSAVWLMIAWWQYRFSQRNLISVGFKLAIYAVFTGLFLLSILSIDTPFIFVWSLLIISASMYFGGTGFLVSSGALLLLNLIVPLTHNIDINFFLLLLLDTGIIILISSLASYMITQTLKDQKELDAVHAQASLQRDRMTTLMNNLADAVIGTDQNGQITLYNAAVLNLLDTNAGLEGKLIDEIMVLRDQSKERVYLTDQLVDSSSVTVRDDLTTDVTGEELRLEITYSPIRSSYDDDNEDDEETGGYILILRDVTTAKSLEEERDEFISVVSHELRTPITIAEGTVSNAMILLERPETPTSKVNNAVTLAHDQIVFLARMVNDLSTLSRAERGVADDTEEIDINQLLSSLYHEYQPEAAKKDLKFDLKVPAKVGSVKASRLYLKELLQNFITNAIKYTQQGTITLTAKRTKNSNIEIAVSDSGIGISKADQKKIFEKFYRSEEYRTRETSGTGLGLYVASKLARKLETTINMKSRLNHGSTFSVELPLISKEKP